MSEYVICAEHLSRSFGALKAVDDLSLTVPAGIVFGYLGPNGSGKTTTIRLLLGLLEPSDGTATVLGRDVRSHAHEIRTLSGALLEHPGLYERLSAEDNLEFYARVWRLPGAERRDRIRELLEHMGLWERRRDTVGSWSRGMKQKLAVARAMLHRPRLLFLDEPTAGLDPVAAAALRDDLARLVAREGTTVFLTTHNLSEAEKLCAQVGIVRQGRLLAVGQPDRLRAGRNRQRVEVVGHGFDAVLLARLRARPDIVSAQAQDGRLTLELAGEAETAPLVSLLVSHGALVEEVRKESVSLEDAFLSLMKDEGEAE